MKCQRFEQRKVYCRTMQGGRWLRPQKNPELPEGFWQSIFKGKVSEGGGRVCDELMHNSLIG